MTALIENSLSASATNLKRLVMIRFVVMIGQLSGILYAWFNLQTTLNYSLLLGTLVLLGVVNIATLWRLKKNSPVTTNELFAQLLLDTAALGFQIYLSGGATNPFASYLLVPVSIAAALLPAMYTASITGLSLIAYTLLLFIYQPLEALQPHIGQPPGQTNSNTTESMHIHDHSHMQHSIESGSSFSFDAINLHVFGMWLNFAISAVLITFFVVRMARTVREQQTLLNQKREDDLRNTQIVAIASLAAGTAHELGTPLNTIQLLLDELDTNPDQQDIDLLKQQIAQCKKIISQLSRTAELHQREKIQNIQLTDFVQKTLDSWQLLRPQVRYSLTVKNDGSTSPFIAVDTTLSQALCNLLNNAADACINETIDIHSSWNDSQCIVTILDHGPGFSKEISEKLGQPFITRKSSGQGMGLGIYLSQATIERFGGTITFANHPQGGAVVTVILPMADAVIKTDAEKNA